MKIRVKDGFGHIMVVFLDKYGEMTSFMFFYTISHKQNLKGPPLFSHKLGLSHPYPLKLAVSSGCRNLLWVKLKFLSLDDRHSLVCYPDRISHRVC